MTDAKEIVRTSKLKGSIKLLNYYIERFIVFPQSSVVLKRTSYLVQSTFLMRCLQGFFEWSFGRKKIIPKVKFPNRRR